MSLIRPLLCALLLTSALGQPVLSAAPVQQAASSVTADRLAAFDARVEAVRAQFDVPGIAVAIVKDGQVVLARGYGVREIGKPEKVDAHTMFAIASNTKAFTATALQMLAEDGKLAMDDRVIDHLPWFRMSDPYITTTCASVTCSRIAAAYRLVRAICCTGRRPTTPRVKSPSA